MTDTMTISEDERRALVASDNKQPVRQSLGENWWAVEPAQRLMSGAAIVRVSIVLAPVAA